MKVLELFAGSRSFSKVAENMGMQTFTTDIINFKKIDFLNIDIEGHELKILENFDFENTYVKTICVEMIDHNEKSKEKNHKIRQI